MQATRYSGPSRSHHRTPERASRETDRGYPVSDTLRTIAARAALAKRMGELLAERTTDTRDEVLAALLDLRREHGMKSAVITLPDGTPIGTVTLTEPNDSFQVVDDKAFLRWVEDNHPNEVEYVPTVRPSFKKMLLEGWAENTTDDGVVVTDKETGEQVTVAGVSFIPAPAPTSFSIKFTNDKKRGIDGRERAAEYLDRLGFHAPAIEALEPEPAAAGATVAGEVVRNEQDEQVPA